MKGVRQLTTREFFKIVREKMDDNKDKRRLFEFVLSDFIDQENACNPPEWYDKEFEGRDDWTIYSGFSYCLHLILLMERICEDNELAFRYGTEIMEVLRTVFQEESGVEFQIIDLLSFSEIMAWIGVITIKKDGNGREYVVATELGEAMAIEADAEERRIKREKMITKREGN